MIMKKPFALFRLSALLVCIGSSVSCMTSYDAYGNQRQSVDPGVALVGVAAAGLAGYAIANSNNNNYSSGYGGSYSSGSYYGSGYGDHGGYGNGGGYYDNGGSYGSYGGGYSDGYTNCY